VESKLLGSIDIKTTAIAMKEIRSISENMHHAVVALGFARLGDQRPIMTEEAIAPAHRTFLNDGVQVVGRLIPSYSRPRWRMGQAGTDVRFGDMIAGRKRPVAPDGGVAPVGGGVMRAV
jgi:hypothetical protein